MKSSSLIRHSNRSPNPNHRIGNWIWTAALGLALSGFLTSSSEGEELIYFEPHTGFSEVVDTENPGKYATLPGPPHAVVRGSNPSRAGNLTFNVTYADVAMSNGIGFDDASEGEIRRATAEAVLTYINDLLNETTGATIDVQFLESQTDGKKFLAAAGTFYAEVNGFSNGIAFLHITTGADPSAGVVDIRVTVDFGWTWNSDQGTPAGGEFDLFSVLLHEYTHGLGYVNLTDSAGNSEITFGNPGKYGIYAQLTEVDDGGTVGVGSSTAIWTGSGATASFSGLTSDLRENRLVFVGAKAVAAFGSNPRIYSPSSFSSGSSLSHWDPSVGTAVMRHFVSKGVEVRDYAPFEIAALVDLGYSSAAAGDSLDQNNPYVDFGAGSNGNGASISPFDNLADALSAASIDNAIIHIAPGTSPEMFSGVEKIDQDVTLQNTTGLSSVLIGSDARRNADGASSSGFVSRSRKE
ncbi:MAG: hypothetical protein IIB38_15265 [Candidatus Hydrogenedentes bacterium]|nr:hypothetical protein [Candidatus Hydrogenedentota bacterium]